MRPITISIYKSEKANTPNTLTESWEGIVKALSQRGHEPRATKGGKAIGFYELHPGTTRSTDNVRLIHAVALDFDDCTAYEDIAESLAPYEHFFHTSFSHTTTCPKGRVILPLTRPATSDEWPMIWRGANILAGEVADSNTCDASRIFYVPSCAHEHTDQARVEHRTGKWLDTDETIRIGSQANRKIKGNSGSMNTAPFGSFNVAQVYDESRVRNALERMDWNDYEHWLKSGMALHSTGSGDATFVLWTEYSKRSTKFNETAQRAAWSSFKTDRDSRITLGWLFHTAGLAEMPLSHDKPALSQLGLSERFLIQHSHEVRFVTGENVFLVWDGRLWQRDHGERLVTAKMIETVKSILRDEVTELVTYDGREAKKTADYAIKVAQQYPTMSAALKFVSINPTIAIEARALDAGLQLLQVENGIVNLQTGKLLASKREMLHTRSSTVQHKDNAICPRWMAFLREVTCGDTELETFLQRIVGYSLSGLNTAQCLFFLHGLGANGKSVFLNVLRELAGTYATTAKADTFMLQQRSGGGASPDIVAMQSSRIVCVTEIPKGQRLDEAQIKTLTGCEETSARQLYGRQFTFTPRFKLWFAGNHKPEVRGRDHGIWRRIVLIPFTAQFSLERQDPDLLTKLKAEMPGILNWAINGFHDFAQGGLRPPQTVSDEVEAYNSDEDILADWLAACCDFDPKGAASRDELYSSYVAHCGRRSVKSIGNKQFIASLRERGNVVDTKSTGVRGFQGIRLRGVPDMNRLSA